MSDETSTDDESTSAEYFLRAAAEIRAQEAERSAAIDAAERAADAVLDEPDPR